jgi:hypothetical protein
VKNTNKGGEHQQPGHFNQNLFIRIFRHYLFTMHLNTRLLAIALVSLIEFSCSPEKKQQIELRSELSSANENFMQFVARLPPINLPFETTCATCCPASAIDISDSLIIQFTPPGTTILGLLENRNGRVVILMTSVADTTFPSVRVYDRQGALIEEKNFMVNYCGHDVDYATSQYLKIDTDMSFISIDTVFYFEMDTIDYTIADTSRLEITYTQFRLDTAGKFMMTAKRAIQ